MSLTKLSTSAYGLRAAFNSINIYLARRDVQYTSVVNSGGKAAFVVGSNLGLTVGSLAYVESLSDHDYTGWHEVINCTATYVILDTLFVTGLGHGAVSSDELYSNYFVLFQI